MSTYVALLRGINVPGNNKIDMAKLKESFGSLGHTNVRTYINSGNVLFETRKKNVPKLTSEIEKRIQEDFSLTIPVVLRDADTIIALCNKIPALWVNDKDSKTDVFFLWEAFANSKILDLLDINPKVDTVQYSDGALVWHLKKKDYANSGIHNVIGTDVYKHATVRNINTVRKLAMLLN